MAQKNRDSDRAAMKAVVVEVADHFLSLDDLPEVGIHFARLQREGHSIESAKAMIGSIITTHIYLAKKKGAPVDYTRLKLELARLPKLSSAADPHQIDIREINEKPA